MKSAIPATIALLLTTQASAVPVRWEVSSYFPGDSQVTGSFFLDVDTRQIWDIDLVSTPGPADCPSGPCTTPGAHYSHAHTLSFDVDQNGNNYLIGYAFVSSAGPDRTGQFFWDGNFLPRVDPPCGPENEEECYPAGLGNFPGSWEILESESIEIQCLDFACSDSAYYRTPAYDSTRTRLNVMTGTVVPLPPALWLLGTAIGLIAIRKRRGAQGTWPVR